MRRWGTFLLTVALTAAACGDAGTEGTASSPPPIQDVTATSSMATAPTTAPSTTTSAAEQATVGTYEVVDCSEVSPVWLRTWVECGYVTVPLDHDDPAGATIRIATAFVDHSRGDRPPLMVLTGGPGYGGIWMGGLVSGWPSDVLLFDQRGTGASEPSLDCPEIDSVFVDTMAIPTSDWDDTAHAAGLAACRSRLVAEGVDLDQFTSAQSARDIGVVHRAMGFEEVDLYGHSYGTRLALTKLRDDPGGVRSILLESVEPLDANWGETHVSNVLAAIERLNQACAADEACAHSVGDLPTMLGELFDQLNVNPAIRTVDHPLLGTITVHVDGGWPGILVHGALYSGWDLRDLPAWLARAADGDVAALDPLVEGAVAGWDPAFSDGMNLSVLCREEVPFWDPATVAAQRELVPEYLDAAIDIAGPPDYCHVWDVPPSDPIENQPVADSRDIPVLVLAGSFDPTTPPEWSQTVAERLGAHYVEVPSAGHWVLFSTSCLLRTVLSSWVRDPTDPDLRCVDLLGPPDLVGFDSETG